jgi:hypothetical protein
MKRLLSSIVTCLIFTILTLPMVGILPASRALADPQPLQQLEDAQTQNGTQNLAPANCSNKSQAGIQQCLQTNPIVKDLNVIVDFLSIGVGVVVVGTIILGGIQYTMAGDNSEGVNKAKHRITNGILALGVYLLIFGFLQWIVPGGVFNSP